MLMILILLYTDYFALHACRKTLTDIQIGLVQTPNVSRRTASVISSPLLLEGHLLDQVKYFGVILSHDLSWSEQV